MRYAHMRRERSSGGVEQHLRLLNRALVERSRALILQMYLAKDGETSYTEEEVGLGRIIWVPVLPFRIDSRMRGLIDGVANAYRRVRDCHEGSTDAQFGQTLSFLHSIARHSGHLLRHKRAMISDRMACLLRTHGVDLLVLHWLTYDTQVLISSAVRAGIPFMLINQFENSRLNLPRIRRYTPGAAGIAGVTGLDVPEELQSRFVNLSDAVDLEFFCPEKETLMEECGHPVILMPARIAPGKGHHDMMQAAKVLSANRFDFELWFAGAVESPSLRAELNDVAAGAHMQGRVKFLGEVKAEEMRERYARSAVVVLPSHSEGLPRTLLEAQAMKKPVVAYDSGGIREALLPGETGFLVPRGSIIDLARKVALLITDEGLRQRMGALGRDFVIRRFSIAALVDRHERFYLSALSARKTGLR
jgi:glycosyltransferase involved in cell wall biosynthesis